MKRLFAPWRASGVEKTRHEKESLGQNCPFCTQFKESQDNPEIAAKNFILKRFTNSMVILNKFPYNAGHLLILPIRHVATLLDLTPEERSELMELSSISTEILTKCVKCDGFNIGINIGKASGASIPYHLHTHILPRRDNDTNFMPVLAETKIISFDLGEIYNKLKPEFENISI